MPTIRQQIIRQIESRLKNIQVSKGYSTNIGERVYYGRAQEPTPNDLPALIFYDPGEEAAPTYGGDARRFTLSLELYARVPDETLPMTANSLKGDLDYALFRDPITGELDRPGHFFGGLAVYAGFNRSEIFLLEGPHHLSGLLAEYQIVYQQAYGDASVLAV